MESDTSTHELVVVVKIGSDERLDGSWIPAVSALHAGVDCLALFTPSTDEVENYSYHNV